MDEVIRFLTEYGAIVLFTVILLEQLGLPLPSQLFLIAAGALVGAGKLALPLTLFAAVIAAVIPDILWFELGRRRGGSILALLCRISLEPDTCKIKTERAYARFGLRSLLFSKFLPGYSTAAPPLAGVFGAPYARFLFFDVAGAVIWVIAYMGLGALFSNQIEQVAAYAAEWGFWALVVVATILAAYIVCKYFIRRALIHRLLIGRITTDELKQMIEAGGKPAIVDLRHKLEFELSPFGIPGAVWIDPDEIEQRLEDIPRDRDVVLYCS